MATEREVRVVQDDSARQEYRFLRKMADGRIIPWDLTGFDVRLIVKALRSDADSVAQFIYTTVAVPPVGESNRITVVDAKGGVIRVDYLAADLDTAADWFYRFRIESVNEKRTLAYGLFKVLDV